MLTQSYIYGIVGPMMILDENFFSKVQKTETCWLWTGCKVRGYGQVTIFYKRFYAHRLSFEAAKGKIPEGLEIDHLCHVKNCVNPDHLEAVTPKSNMKRRRPFRVR